MNPTTYGIFLITRVRLLVFSQSTRCFDIDKNSGSLPTLVLCRFIGLKVSPCSKVSI